MEQAASSGRGEYQETLVVLDGDGNAVEGAKVQWWNSSGVEYAREKTDANGVKVFLLDADTYEAGVSRIGIGDKLDTVEITGAGTDTISVVAYTPPAAPGGDSVCVIGDVREMGYKYPRPGLKAIFSVEESGIQDTSTGVFLEKVSIEIPVSDTGRFEGYVPASTNLVPWNLYKAGHWGSSDTVFYHVEIKDRNRVVLPPMSGVFIPDSTGCLNMEDVPFR